MAAKPETVFRNRVSPLIEKIPRCEDTTVQQKSIRGTPDKLLCIDGVFVALEFKRTQGTLEKLQRHKLRKIQAAGGFAYMVTPENWEQVYAALLTLSEGTIFEKVATLKYHPRIEEQ